MMWMNLVAPVSIPKRQFRVSSVLIDKIEGGWMALRLLNRSRTSLVVVHFQESKCAILGVEKFKDIVDVLVKIISHMPSSCPFMH